jgi:hypothetical protein
MEVVSFLDSNSFFLYSTIKPHGVSYSNTVEGAPPSIPVTLGLQWRYVNGEWIQVENILVPSPPRDYGTKITKLAFLNRLGDNVLAAIEEASRVNNPLGYAAAVIKIKHSSSTYIDLSLPETHTDIQKLVDYGFIDTTKRDEIINTPVAEKEVPLFISNQII